jgi:peptide/nickel transport system permease protein
MIQLFSVRWRWFPPDAQFLPQETQGFGWVNSLVLPVITLAIPLIAEWVRYVRSGFLTVLTADYIRAARARGISEGRILWAHVLPNGLVPFLTILGLSLPNLVGGELVVEMVFGWPGLGQLEYNAVREQDHSVAMAALLLVAAATLFGSLLADLAHAWLDPRIRSGILRETDWRKNP